MSNMNQSIESELPPIDITGEEMRRLRALVDSSMDLFPHVSQYLALYVVE